MKNIGEIDTNRIEGRLLIAALTILTTTENLIILKENVKGTSTEPDKMLQLVKKVSDEIYKKIPLPEGIEVTPPTFERELTSVLNRYSKENESNTPDFILAAFLMDCLKAGNHVISSRENWYGVKHRLGQSKKK